ncbi:MAG: hypothetical protein K6T94_17145 [Paenibacillus sp.]|nr:hypothetical protein [Paenibacillus sp.]
MAAGFYQFYLFPSENRVLLSDEFIEFIGDEYVPFDSFVSELLSIEHIIKYSPKDKWPSFDDECYYCYDDGMNMIEMELNAGTKEEKITEISVRTSLYKSYGNISITIDFCREICNRSNLKAWDMKLKHVIDFNNQKHIKSVINKFESYKKM